MHVSMVTVLISCAVWRLSECASWQKPRRNSIREALSNKVDPNFWPARGRRSSDIKHFTRQTADEEGPFWANRGRSLQAFMSEVDPQWGSISTKGFYGNQVRSTDDKGPFWANRGRALAEEDTPFWANRGRAAEDGPFWANRGRAAEEGPFWANRGRSIENLLPTVNQVFDEANWEIIFPQDGTTAPPDDPVQYAIQKISQDKVPVRLNRDVLFVEEPTYHEMIKPNHRRSANKFDDTFWVSRGKRRAPDVLPRYVRAHKPSRALDQLKEKFWPARGKKAANNV